MVKTSVCFCTNDKSVKLDLGQKISEQKARELMAKIKQFKVSGVSCLLTAEGDYVKFLGNRNQVLNSVVEFVPTFRADVCLCGAKKTKNETERLRRCVKMIRDGMCRDDFMTQMIAKNVFTRIYGKQR